FEVLLIASYGLMIHSGGPRRLRAGLQYVVMNLAGSTLFLFALGTIYGTLGTLNMADLAEKAASIGPDNAAILAVAAVLLLIVFAVKAAAFPVQFWLPGTYSNAPAPVAALFAIMTKVGAYAIIRVYTLIFGESTPDVAALIQSLLIPAALLTLIVGAVGVLGARRLERMIAFSVLSSMGTLMIAIALFTETGLNAALYYLIHSTFATAGLFLVADLVRKAEAEGKPPHGLTVTLYFIAAVAMAGMPPLTGFLGKLFVLQATAEADWATIAWWVILVTSLLTIVGFTRMGSALFWKPATAPGPDAPETALPGGLATTATAIPLVVLTAVTLTSGPVAGAMGVTAAQLTARTPYIDAVLYPETRAGDRLIRGGGAYEPGGSHYKGDETTPSADTTDASTEVDSTGSTH
ncbi:MAG: proton-conducting transporter membrane subunit, partial [Pseudomonadota bacterium]